MVAIGMVFLTPRGVETLVEPPYEQPLPRAEPEVILDAEVASHA
jgi:hypothetical protein